MGDPGPRSIASRRSAVPSKVSQVDADDLDDALVDMIGERVHRSLGQFGQGAIDWKPEVDLLLKLVIFRYGVWDPLRASSPGASLQQMRLSQAGDRPTRKRLLLYLLLHPPIFPLYLLTRLRSYALSKQWPDLPNRDWRRKAWRGILFLEGFSKAWKLAGWLGFLIDPRYPSLLMRWLGLRLVPTSAHLTRLISYEFSNRQLVWSAFTEFLMFAIPLLSRSLDLTRLGGVKKLLRRPETVDYTSVLPSFKHAVQSHTGALADLPLTCCPLCHQRRKTTAPVGPIELPVLDADGGEEEEVFIPAETDCWGGCRYCYYCIAGELARHREQGEADKAKWECLRCGGAVVRAWRVADLELKL